MKRSEMLDLMAKTIVCEDSGFTLSIAEADILLKEMESVGVQPPNITLDELLPKSVLYADKAHFYACWEPEDEK